MRADDKIIEGLVRSSIDYEYKHRNDIRLAKALTESEVEQLIEDFVAAARRLEAAGVDGIEVHAAHGFLFTQFLRPDLNNRMDKWGGSFQNRARPTREVTRRIRAVVSPNFIVGVRLSPEPGFEKSGWNMDADETLQLAQWLCEDGVDYIAVSDAPTHATPRHAECGQSKPLMQIFREACPKDVIVMACGGIHRARCQCCCHEQDGHHHS
jgi:2,4-dienoyl-CoA reductase-like NADH-dependent reductase (Old Yellow Enzyme family)